MVRRTKHSDSRLKANCRGGKRERPVPSVSLSLGFSGLFSRVASISSMMRERESDLCFRQPSWKSYRIGPRGWSFRVG